MTEANNDNGRLVTRHLQRTQESRRRQFLAEDID